MGMRLSELVQRHTALGISGKKRVGLCPFHAEKTPSFMVDDQRNYFYCLGCGKNGDGVSFIMALHQIDRQAAETMISNIEALQGGG